MLISISVLAKSDIDYLPDDVSYDADISKPEDVLGSPVGEWHVRHDQLVQYMRTLATESDRVTLIETGRTYENRPLVLLAITSPQNQSRLEQIRQEHVKTVREGKALSVNAPLVLWMGYSVHGDEASGSNAAMLVAYYLAAGQGEKIDALLTDNVVLLDPSLNPDGLSRFAQWVNMHKGNTLVSDPEHREHVQAWPSGRTNHYWFDLNRDWLLLVHPESRARIKQFQRWRPHVLTDFHEMGVDSTYFFQPGIPSRKNPWTSDENADLTAALGNFHAAALDKEKQLYFTQESFDDFYYGKGSTYPDAQGTVGILFEQASSRGHLQDSIHGTRSFADAVQNQVTTSLSTFEGALQNKQALLQYQQTFNSETQKLIKNDPLRGYLLQEQHDRSKLAQLIDVLQQHEITVQTLKKEVEIDDTVYRPSDTVFVPVDQPKYRLIKSIFSTRTRFNDNTFYDVSNWNLPLAYNISFKPVDKGLWRKVSVDENQSFSASQPNSDIIENAYAYAFSWQDSNAPALLQGLINKGVQVRLAEQAFSATTTQGEISLSSGAVVIPTGLAQPDDLVATLKSSAQELGIRVWSVTSGLTSQGVDLGSRRMVPANVERVLIVGGKEVSQYEAGEVWHYLDQHVGMPVSIVELFRLGKIDLSRYSHMIWVNGNYSDIDDSLTEAIEAWVKHGGVLIGQKGASKLFSEKNWLKAKFVSRKDISEAFDSKSLSFSDREAFAAKQRIAGAVFKTKLDLGHPLAFGYTRETLPVFRNSTYIMKAPEKPFVTVAQYASKPLMAGYTSDELEELVADSAAVVAHRLGEGKIIAFADNPSFRGYWLGTRRMLTNAIYMSPFIDVKG